MRASLRSPIGCVRPVWKLIKDGDSPGNTEHPTSEIPLPATTSDAESRLILTYPVNRMLCSIAVL